MEEKKVGTKRGKSSKQGLAIAKDLTIMLLKGRDFP